MVTWSRILDNGESSPESQNERMHFDKMAWLIWKVMSEHLGWIDGMGYLILLPYRGVNIDPNIRKAVRLRLIALKYSQVRWVCMMRMHSECDDAIS